MDQDINYNELFDLPDDEAGEQTEETGQDAAPAAAEPAAEPAAAQEEGAEGSGDEQKDGEGSGSEEQSLEERSRQAEYRRRREDREARIREQARAEAIHEMDETLRSLGMPDPNTGEIVDSFDKLRAYDKRLSDARLAKGAGTAEDIRRIIREERSEQTGNASAGAPAGQKPGAEAPTDEDIAAELAEIRRMDPAVKDLRSILDSEVGPKFRSYVATGLNFVDAYTLAAKDRLEALRDSKAKEAAQVKAAGKDHMTSTQSRGQGMDPIPADEMAAYRIFFPDASDSEIRDMAAADRKRQGR